ncbi:UDP-N-acetylmuramate--L-alanine ligase [Larkinella punicea]|uniref:UDP-N-acetylmuramate--L-alanine ligase n=1 Tax=Larkinella punicea TaxID=2315727 RepID=A0A368JN70_9BACT|nr:UDP-N-acetylmuramate--L-alanine ligase [Larkinella punicea]RCR68023.1 UDP-N-acetylmuramate--L-alanine ligase [Larkinella punicea]
MNNIRYVYFLGIGGIGMSALARWFLVNGYEVAGYDRTATALTNALQQEGMAIHFEEDVEQIPAHFRENRDETLVIYTPAVPKTHQEYIYLTEHGFTLQKRSQVLGLLAGRMTTVAIAGTHGKTTTSSMVAHILKDSGVNCAAFLGGITQNYGTNFLLNEPTDDLSKVICVVEADEFDRSFLTLFPQVAIVTSTDADHLDIYGDHNAVLDSFSAFVSQIKPDGTLFMKRGLALADRTPATVYEYALDEGSFYSKNLRIENACFVFDIVYPQGVIENIALQMPGFHNVENAVAAAAAALQVGVAPEQIRQALGNYKGVKRRFEYILKSKNVIFIDDYAHHPAEVFAFLSSLKALYPERKVTAIFQPHLFSRTRDFADAFAKSLSLADRVILLDIYPARELPIEGVSADLIFKSILSENKVQCTKADLPDLLRKEPPELVATIGAGDIDQMIPVLRNLFETNQ